MTQLLDTQWEEEFLPLEAEEEGSFRKFDQYEVACREAARLGLSPRCVWAFIDNPHPPSTEVADQYLYVPATPEHPGRAAIYFVLTARPWPSTSVVVALAH